jgi:1-acyl-sn-glycerol-3-phosphate acyltransferase
MHLVLRLLGWVLMRVFYRTGGVVGAARVPATGPVIVVANHPNGLLDPLVAKRMLGRPLAFLAKSTFFKTRYGLAAMRAFDAMPVYRPRDGEDTGRNEETFQKCRERLAHRGWLMLFPEGTSHSDSRMKPLKTGAARIALEAEAARGFLLGVKILPVGLLYEDKAIFRSRASAAVGEAIEVSAYARAYAEDPRAAVEALTHEIASRLSAVVLEADDQELWGGLVAVASWTAPDGGRDVGAVQARAQDLSEAWQRLMQTDPVRASHLADLARRFSSRLKGLGVQHPFSVEAPPALSVASVLRFALPMILLAPIAAVGMVLGYLPYRAVGRLAEKNAGEEDVVATAKAVGGLVLLVPWWLLVGVVAGVALGPAYGLGLFALGPLTGYVALRWSERAEQRKDVLRGLWLGFRQAGLAEEITLRREELAMRVEEALAPREVVLPD